jgi:hypothetical protein
MNLEFVYQIWRSMNSFFPMSMDGGDYGTNNASMMNVTGGNVGSFDGGANSKPSGSGLSALLKFGFGKA